MKKTIVRLVVVLLGLSLIGCTACPGGRGCGSPPPPPYGIWQSIDPNITLFIAPEFRLSQDIEFSGIYVRDGEEVRVRVLAPNSRGVGAFLIFEDIIREDKTVSERMLYFGEIYIENDRIYMDLLHYFSERTGIDTIIFELVE